MTSLEYIRNKISKKIKTINEKRNFMTNCKQMGIPFNSELAYKDEKELEYLRQVEYELEAWYSIKQGIKLCEGKVYEDSYYEYLQFEEELFDESESEEAGERLNPIKKALEVEE